MSSTDIPSPPTTTLTISTRLATTLFCFIASALLRPTLYSSATAISSGSSSSTTPDQCCRRHGVPEVCVKTLCYPKKPPGDFDVYDVFDRRNDCSKYLRNIGQCLAQGRDHTRCCVDQAKDRDESACFGLCRGQVHHHTSGQSLQQHSTHLPWTQYQTCLAINLPSMFSCFEKGYREAPTPPSALTITNVAAREALLSWTQPADNAPLVHHYEVQLVEGVVNVDGEDVDNEGDEDAPARKVVRTQGGETQLLLQHLEPGTRYSIKVVAVAVAAVAATGGEEGGWRSMPSEAAELRTVGVAPQAEPYKETVSVSRSAASVLLACRFQLSGSSRTDQPHLQWQHEVDGEWVAVERSNFRFNQSHYLYSAARPRWHVMTLEIYDISQPADLGAYRCSVRDEFGEGSARVELRAGEIRMPNAQPPNTPLACCKSKGVEERCLSMCGATDTESKRYVPRPMMPANCSGEISRVLTCAMPEVDDSQCCLRQRLPRQCMYLCDSSEPPANQMSATCLEHLSAVEQCRTTGVEKRPGSIHNLRVQNANSHTSAQTALVAWDASANADIYHVYWRNTRSSTAPAAQVDWTLKSQVPTTRKIINADEVVIVAANVYGISQAAVLRLGEDGKWARSNS